VMRGADALQRLTEKQLSHSNGEWGSEDRAVRLLR
jgi:hypothetical protein